MLAFKSTDMGRICTGVPEGGSTRYWKSRGKNLTRLAMGLDLDRGRNKSRKREEEERPAGRPIGPTIGLGGQGGAAARRAG
eukprot:1846214-Heterocapsa_arctica.AAC.1